MALDARVAWVAGRQSGVVAHDQLLGCGLTAKAIRHRRETGRLHRLHRGVYVVGHAVLAPLARETAALLACGPGAVISHGSAAILWDLPVLTSAVDVTVAPSRRPRHAGITTHRAALARNEIRTRHGLPVTSPVRTLTDLAATTPADELERLIAEARAARLITTAQLAAVPGRRGAATLRAVLHTGPRWTRSEAERALLRLIREAGLPTPETNVAVAGCNVDALWRDRRVAVEVDSWAFHGHRAAFERDRSRDQRLRDAGFTPVRLTARQLEDDRVRLAAHLAHVLATPAG